MTSCFKLEAVEQSWPMDKPFRIARGMRTSTRLIVVTLTNGPYVGRGESAPSARYNESIESVLTQIRELDLNSGAAFDRQKLQELLPAGSARNALDCALWDLEAKSSNRRVWEIANLPVVDSIETTFTISLDTPEEMAAVARAHSDVPLLKLKLGGDNLDVDRVKAVCKELATARLIVDANESWTPAHYRTTAPALHRLGVELIEQPFPADADGVLEELDHPIPVCADESCRTSLDLPKLTKRYEVVNIKLDKTGGLTEALRLSERARESQFRVFIGCMACTSLGIAPARLLAQEGDYVDLDGPLLLAGDRHHRLPYEHGRIGLPPASLWG
jgi:L-alanine-DL-glutamate epimerase-like enolase superfamily enzyme